MADPLPWSERLTPRQRQFLTLAAIALVLFAVLWALFALTDHPRPAGTSATADTGARKVTHVGVMAPGAQLDPREKWIGEAGKDVAQLKQDRDQARSQIASQERFNQEILGRFEALKQELARAPAASGNGSGPSAGTSPAYPPSNTLQGAASSAANLPPPPPPARAAQSAMSPGMPPTLNAPLSTGLVRVTIQAPAASSSGGASASPPPAKTESQRNRHVDNYLPVSFTRAVLLGGLDAPTGGQSQTNPHPVLLRLVDNAVLPNRHRSEVRECLVIGAGYGDISSERAYIRTENLSCIRHDGSALEIPVQGSIFGEDGKVGMRGRLVTKQGQLLANALLAGVVSGIGTAFSQYYTTTTTSTFGTIATTDPNKLLQSGLGVGVGSAMNRLANYYISLAEKIFPVVEVDAGRMVDVVLTKGVAIDTPVDLASADPSRSGRRPPHSRTDDDDPD